ncbi:hypothetical protein D3C76_1565230 [compost metagenome]
MQHFDNPLGLQLFVRIIVAERKAAFAFGNFGNPRFGVGPFGLCVGVSQHIFHITDTRNVGRHVFADLGRVYINVCNLCLGSKTRQLGGHPVVEAGADGNQ